MSPRRRKGPPEPGRDISHLEFDRSREGEVVRVHGLRSKFRIVETAVNRDTGAEWVTVFDLKYKYTRHFRPDQIKESK